MNKIRFAVSVSALLAAILFGGCKKEVPEKDVEIVFTRLDVSSVSVDAVRAILDSEEAPTIRTIYLVPEEGTWNNCGATTVSGIPVYFEPVFALSPKVRGKGDFNFGRGQASLVPNDSLWIVNHGWTINKRFLENN